MSILSFVHTKGGVGKTTISVAVSLNLIDRGKKVLVVDIDDQCNTSRSLIKDNIYDENSHAVKLFSDSENLPEIKPIAISENLYLLQADDELSAIDTGERFLPYYFKQNIELFYKDYDYIIIDPPGHYGLRLSATLDSCNNIATPIELEKYSTDALKRLIDLITKIRRTTNPDLNFLGVIPNKVNGVNSEGLPIRVIEKQIYNDIKKIFGDNIILPYLCSREALRKLQDPLNTTINTLQKDKNTSAQLNNLTDEILKKTIAQ